MSQLHKFIDSLNAAELNALQQVRLIGKEKSVFDLTFSYRNKNFPEPDEICDQLEISPAHLYKINSVLLNKSYGVLVPAGGLRLLEYLKQKGQFILIRSEARTQEKQLLQLRTGKNILEKFYLGLFHLFIDFPFRYYDKKLVDEYGKKYLESKVSRNKSDDLYVHYHKLFADVNRCAASRNPIRSFATDFRSELQQENILKREKHYLALYYLHRAEASWYTLYEPNHQKKLAALEKAIKLKDKIAWFFEIDIGGFLQLLYADALLTGNEPEKALEVYNEVFKKGLSENMFGYYYFCEQYALLKIINKEMDAAQKFLDTVFSSCIKQGLDIFASRGALAYAKLFLAKKQFKDAVHYINTGYSINEKNYYLPFEVQLRLLETIAFAGKKEYDFALKLCRRNLKFAENPGEKKILEEYILFWTGLEELLKLRKKNKEAESELIGTIKQFSDKYRNLYCGLPEKILLQ
jgi:hypothetical protein